MKVAVTALGESLESPLDQRFGRTRFFVIYDTETGDWSAHDNMQNLESASGAGIQSGQRVADLGAEAVITGHCGPKAFRTLSAAGIAVYQEATGSVREALDAFKAGRLKKSDNPNAEQGFGGI